jgi:hypothetical protein
VEQNYYVRVEVIVMSTLYANAFVGFLAPELVRLHVEHICIVVQRLIIVGVQAKEHHIYGSTYHGHENNMVQVPTYNLD